MARRPVAMIPVMVARDSVTAEQGILVSSSSSSRYSSTPPFPVDLRDFSPASTLVNSRRLSLILVAVTPHNASRATLLARNTSSSGIREKKNIPHETGHEPFTNRSDEELGRLVAEHTAVEETRRKRGPTIALLTRRFR